MHTVQYGTLTEARSFSTLIANFSQILTSRASLQRHYC